MRVSDILDLPVVVLEEGKEIGKVKDVIFDPENMTLRVIAIGIKGLLGGVKFVLYEKVESIGENALILPNRDVLIPSKKAPEIKNLMEKKLGILNTPVLTRAGTRLGEVSDVIIHADSGALRELEVTRGWVKDITRGRSGIPATMLVSVGEDAVIVSDEVQEESFGLKEALEHLAKSAAKTKKGIDRVLGEKEEAYCLGKMAGMTIKDDQDRIIIAKGEIISEEHVCKAKERGKLHELALSVGFSLAQEKWKDIQTSRQNKRKKELKDK
ncbi:MAG: PRC-barrel domain-containing protein [Actinomycetota bacterium]|nr:PRC-barrel domain-containing protein [Actinomycetota bacterium]